MWVSLQRIMLRLSASLYEAPAVFTKLFLSQSFRPFFSEQFIGILTIATKVSNLDQISDNHGGLSKSET